MVNSQCHPWQNLMDQSSMATGATGYVDHAIDIVNPEGLQQNSDTDFRLGAATIRIAMT
jgi:hypothetical protein